MNSHKCAGCGRSFRTAQGLGLHWDHARKGHGGCNATEQTETEAENLTAVVEAYRADLTAEKARADDLDKQLWGWCEDLVRISDENLRNSNRADDLSRTVAAMGEALEALVDEQNGPPLLGRHEETWNAAMDGARAILSRPDVTAERGRWVTVADFMRSGAKALVAMAQRDAAIARAEKAEGDLRKADADRATAWDDARVALAAQDALGIQLAACQERLRLAMAAEARAEALTFEAGAAERARDSMRGERDRAERSRDELGIQLAACQDRLRLAMAVVEAARLWADEVYDLRRTIAALDAVPGDALAPSASLKVEAYTVEQIRAAFARACLDASTPFFPRWPEIANAVVDALATSTKAGTCNCGRAATCVDPRNDAARCDRYPNCDRTPPARDIGPALDRAHEASGVVTGGRLTISENGVKEVE